VGKGVIHFVIPLATKSEANCRDHWRVKARRVKEQRSVMAMAVGARISGKPSKAWVKMTRATARARLDGDNLESALKACRDGIADALGIDDGSERILWEYAQEKGKGGTVRVQIEYE
jgi:crossover junction endodeoxyribonuclease RusA